MRRGLVKILSALVVPVGVFATVPANADKPSLSDIANPALSPQAAVFVSPLASSSKPSVDRIVYSTIGTDDNIVSTREGTPHLAEQFLDFGVAASASLPLRPGLSLRGQSRLVSRLHARYKGLNEVAIGLDGQLLLRSGRSFYAPVFGVSLGFGGSQFNSALRDGLELRSSVFVRNALTTRISSVLRLSADHRNSSGAAFDSERRAAAITLNWQPRPALGFSLAYEYRDGDITSLRRPSKAALAFLEAVQPDDVFDNRQAARFKGVTHLGRLGAQYALTAMLLLDTELRYAESTSGFDTRYQ